VSRVLDWFWLVSAERAARAPFGTASARVLELSARASLAYEAAQRTARPAEPFAQTGAEALSCELYREAIHAALVAHLELRSAGAGAAPVPELAPALDQVDAAVRERLADGGAALDALRSELVSGSYLAFAELAAAEQKRLSGRLGSLSEALLEPLSGLRRRLERIWARRVLHVAVLLGVLASAVWGLRATLRWREDKTDLAARATWTVSSTYAVGGCNSPQQRCVGGENYFFHTGQEQNPWVKFDLGKERRVSGIAVENRRDCCSERADPLVVAVSVDGKKWTEVARHTGSFTEWSKGFPAAKARYVKLQVAAPHAILHLSRVRIFP